ncbi:MAG: GH116 family glycosyl-hydrolase [Verrucomicrobiota bacterium]
MSNPQQPSDSKGSGAMIRRDFLQTIGLGAATMLVSRLPVMAGPFAPGEFEKLVPADKKLDAEWVKSLFARGTPEILRGQDLKFIGMPVGGICAGQVYLGGDGKLWHWDIFNHQLGAIENHYTKPIHPTSPLEQKFALTLGDKTRTLDKVGFADISFRGEYPIGRVEYRADDVVVTLEAFSPFIPLNTDDSSLPATVMQFTVKNTTSAAVEATLTGTLENVIARSGAGTRRSRIVAGNDLTFLECYAEKPNAPETPPQPDLVFEDWHQETYDAWIVEGTAFGSGPIKKSAIPRYQGEVGGDTERVVNSHATAPGNGAGEKDNATGKLTSRAFPIERNFITAWIGGGSHKGKTCVNLVVAGKAVQSLTGKNDNKMALQSFDVRALKGKEAVLEIVDAQQGAWGNIGVGKITFSDRSAQSVAFEKLPDNGTMGLALLGPAAEVANDGALGRKLKLPAGQSAVVTFVLTWHFPNLTIQGARDHGRFYATKFDSAVAVAKYVADHFERLASQTRLWRDTWYDSTLPYWFLDRTQVNTSILATSTCQRFTTGRFWAWEGVGCCAGTCGHVWHYAQAMARQFPELERILREKTDFGLALQPDGAIYFRGENNQIPAIDAQAGSVLRALREHQMSADGAFLKRIWPGVKRATEWLIHKDGDGDGIIASNQHNTLDTDWFGPVAWLSGLYLAALEAAAAMADEMGDAAFAAQCREISARGQKNITQQLFDGEYYINKPDPKHLDAVNSGSGCGIDQVMGQSWAWQVGLPRVFPEKETKSALRSLWKYNFSPDVGPYRAVNKPGRWYAMAGEAGLLMCTFPRNDWGYAQSKGKGPEWAAGYFNECMNGFEHQVAGHMIWEGLVLEGLAVIRAVHDRYHASRRNPYNEVECGDHYARSMASYGVYLAACGFDYHGPNGHIGFAPRLTPDHFKAAFTSAEGWGSFSQTLQDGKHRAVIEVKWGQLKVKTVALESAQATSVSLTHVGKPLAAQLRRDGNRVVIVLDQPLELCAGHKLEITLS